MFIVLLIASIFDIPLDNLVLCKISEETVKRLLALFIFLNSSLCLYKIFRIKTLETGLKWYEYMLPIASGCLQSLFGVGGSPLIAYFAELIYYKIEL